MPGPRIEKVHVEVCGYRETDGGPRDVRVDLVDTEQTVTLASLDPDAALILAADLLKAHLQAVREQGDDNWTDDYPCDFERGEDADHEPGG